MHGGSVGWWTRHRMMRMMIGMCGCGCGGGGGGGGAFTTTDIYGSRWTFHFVTQQSSSVVFVVVSVCPIREILIEAKKAWIENYSK